MIEKFTNFNSSRFANSVLALFFVVDMWSSSFSIARSVMWGRDRPKVIFVCLFAVAFLFGIGVGVSSLRSTADPLLAMASRDDQLRTWLANWQTHRTAGQRVTVEQRAALSKTLSSTHLTCAELVDIGRQIQVASQDDTTTAIIYAAAIQAGDRELQQCRGDSRRAKSVLLSMNSTRSHFWRVIDAGDRSFVRAAHLLNQDLMTWIDDSEQNKELKDAKQRGRIGVAGCLLLEGRVDEALTFIQQSPTQEMDRLQLAAIEWVEALALYQKQSYNDAAEKFRRVTECRSFHHSRQAWPMLAASLARIGNHAAATDAFKTWLVRYKPSARETEPFRRFLEDHAGRSSK